jgi:IS5 family transposase
MEVTTIAICSALFFNSNHQKALIWLRKARYFPEMLSLSRFNRRIHKLKDFVEFCFESIREIFLTGDLYIQDSMPLPVCKRRRASRNKKVQGKEYCGHCAAKKENFFGFRLHLVVDTQGIPVSLAIVPGAYHDLTPLYEITFPLPEHSTVIGDKAYNSKTDEKGLQELGTNLMPIRRKNMKQQWSLWEERFIIREHREQIETSFSILSDVMSLNRLKATSLSGFLLKAYAAILALIFHITDKPNLCCGL